MGKRNLLGSSRQISSIVILVFTLLIILTYDQRTEVITPSEESSVETAQEMATSTVREDLHQVVKVVDGDTIDVAMTSGTERVRFIGMNAPESVDPRRKVECFGKEASASLKKLLTDKRVTLAADATQDDRDTYGRLLRYVSLEDATDVGQKMITDGYAYEYTYRIPYQKQTLYKDIEKSARQNSFGLWASTTCNGKK